MGSDKKKSRMQIAKENWDGFLKFLYDRDEGTVLGRNGNSWSKIFVFYLFYYGFLACLFAISITIVLNTLDEYTPKYQTRLQNPGVAIQPKIPSNLEQTSNIIYTLDTNDEEYNLLVNQMEKFLGPYSLENQTGDNFQDCAIDQPPNTNQEYDGDQKAKVCKFNRADLGPCTTHPYGYDTGEPCVLIKLNRIIDWFPVGFTNLSVPQAAGLTESNAPDLATLLTTYGLQYKPYLMYTACYGYDSDNKVHLDQGDMRNNKYYPPSMGLPFAYYPYKGSRRQPGYLNPIVAVQFTNVTRNQKINVACKVYALNIQDNKDMAEGFFRFEMEIKDKK